MIDPQHPIPAMLRPILQKALLQHTEEFLQLHQSSLMQETGQKSNPQKISTCSFSLKNHLTLFTEAEEKVQTSDDYKQYVKQKEVVRKALTDLASFCSLKELMEHSAITPLAKIRLEQIAQVI